VKAIRNIVLGVAALPLLWFTLTAFAQVDDPPDRVARLNFIQGTVSYLPAGDTDNDWVAAVPNRPLTTGDQVWADANSRGEMHVGSTAIRLDSNTGMSFLNLTSNAMQIRLAEGSLIVDVRQAESGDSFEVDTPNVAFSMLRPGYYRIDAQPDGTATVITVRQGVGEAVGGGRLFRVITDQVVTLSGTETLDYSLRNADSIPTGEFDRWAMSRDDLEDRITSTRYVSPEMTGYEDLDTYGAWQAEPDYGNVWVPANVPEGWAPYRFGHWAWIAPWGWTWVGDEPWGFAPFHYGRWAAVGARWVWVPGPVAARPVYAPHLVAWVGGVHVGAGIGVGWFPLGPREVFVPPYRVSETYVTRINITNTVVERTKIINVYRNQGVETISYLNRKGPNSVTVVSHETFVNARPIARNLVVVQDREFEAAHVSREIAERPERASVYGTGAHDAPQPPARTLNRMAVTREAPPAQPSHFDRPENMPSIRSSSSAEKQPANEAAKPRQNTTAEKPQQAAQSHAKPAPPVHPPAPPELKEVESKPKAHLKEEKKEEKPAAH